jgi:hypothetical protein
MKPCKECKKPIDEPYGWLYDYCKPCRALREKSHARYAGCFLVPLWSPIWLAGDLVGLVVGIFWNGCRSGLDSVKYFVDSWKTDDKKHD